MESLNPGFVFTGRENLFARTDSVSSSHYLRSELGWFANIRKTKENAKSNITFS